MTNKPTLIKMELNASRVVVHCDDGTSWEADWKCAQEAHKEPEAKQELVVGVDISVEEIEGHIAEFKEKVAKQEESKQEQKLPEVVKRYKEIKTGEIFTRESCFEIWMWNGKKDINGNPAEFREVDLDKFNIDFEELPDQDHIGQEGKERTLEFNKDDGFKENQTDKVQEDLKDFHENKFSVRYGYQLSPKVQEALYDLSCELESIFFDEEDKSNIAFNFRQLRNKAQDLVNALEPKQPTK